MQDPIEDIEDDQPVASTSAAAGFEQLPCLEDRNFSTSYSWHSTGKYEGEGNVDSEPWIIGVDEAGRGPVLGSFDASSFSRIELNLKLLQLQDRRFTDAPSARRASAMA
jgi:hypothetical protein